MAGTKDNSGKLKLTVGLLSPEDSGLGMSAYVAQLQRCFPAGDVVQLSELQVKPNSAHNFSCWSRGSKDLSQLQRTLEEQNVGILHLIAHTPFFPAASLLPLLDQLSASNVRLVLQIHDTDQLDENLLQIARRVDQVIVPGTQFACELLARGIDREALQVLEPVAFQVLPTQTESEARSAFGLSTNERLVVAFTDGKSRTELQTLVEAVEKLRLKHAGLSLTFATLQSVQNVSGFDYQAENVSRLSAAFGSRPWVKVLSPADRAEDLSRLLMAASAVVFTERKPFFETQQAFLLALSLKRPIIAAAMSPFLEHEDRVLYLSNRMTLAAALSTIVETSAVRHTLQQNAFTWAETHSWEEYAAELGETYSRLSLARSANPGTRAAPSKSVLSRSKPGRKPRILMQLRPNAFTHPGGDIVVMEKISQHLKARGVVVDIDTERAKNPRDYDLVHLSNFALKENIEQLAKQCTQLGVPYVVTTLYEDWPLFFAQMNANYLALESYARAGQPKERWAEIQQSTRNVRPAPIWDNSLAANSAAALIATGQSEAQALRRDYPASKFVHTCLLGSDGFAFQDGGELFRRETGLNDFVLCVGRFEVRKNQLMLMKALEDSELTLVFAASGFSYQPAYAEACRSFKRKGKTVFLDRMDERMLASAFQAARVHALPGWLELPGLVSLEAARAGANVVVSDFGTVRDYLGDDAFYCRPDAPETILNSVTAAFYAPKRPALAERVKEFTWDRTALSYAEAYQMVLGSRGEFDWSFTREEREYDGPASAQMEASIVRASNEAKEAGRSVGMIPVVVAEAMDEPAESLEATRLCDEGDKLARSGDIAAAKKSYQAAFTAAPNSHRAYRSCGALALHGNQIKEAEEFFNKALSISPENARALVGLASVRWEQGEKDPAFEIYLKAAQLDYKDPLAIFHLVRTGYALDRLKDLEHALRGFLKFDPDNINMLYCLAGCSYRRGRHFLAQGVVDRILKINPEHEEARELADKIKEAQEASRQVSKPTQSVPATPAETAARAETNQAARWEERLRDLENTKRNRNHDEVIAGCDELIATSTVTPLQRNLARILRAEVLACTGKLAEADEVFRDLEGDPSFRHRALAGRGAVGAASGDMKRAEEFFQHSLAVEPKYDVALAGMALCAGQRNESDVAWDYYRRALKSNPENLRAIYGVIQLGYALERLPEVAQVLEDYLDLKPVDLSMIYAYAGCRYAMGEPEKAESELEKILLFEPSHKLANELLEKIRNGEQRVMHAR